MSDLKDLKEMGLLAPDAQLNGAKTETKTEVESVKVGQDVVEVKFMTTMKIYPNGNIYFDKPFLVGGARKFQKKKVAKKKGTVKFGKGEGKSIDLLGDS